MRSKEENNTVLKKKTIPVRLAAINNEWCDRNSLQQRYIILLLFLRLKAKTQLPQFCVEFVAQ